MGRKITYGLAALIGAGDITTEKLADGAVTNDKIAAAAGIPDSKLATISTAAKVSGAAINNLANVPSGAGVLPAANTPITGKSTLAWSGIAAIAPSGSVYVAPGSDAAPSGTAPYGFVVPFAGTIKNLYYRVTASSGAQYFDVAVYKNGVTTTLVKQSTAGGGAQTVSDTTNSFSVVAGDRIYFYISPSGTPSIQSISIEFSPT